MNKLLTLFLISVIFLMSCDSTDDICSNFLFMDSDISNQEDYLIIKAVVNEEFGNSKLSHISQETHFESDSSFFSYYFKPKALELELDVIEKYKTINRLPLNWNNSFDLKQKLISEEELLCLFENSGWIGFYEKYPESSGYLKFGKPLRHNEDEAVVTVDLLCGWECSSGYTATLKKENGKWKVQTMFNIWIS